MAGRMVSFRTTDKDEQVLEGIASTKYGGLSYAALVRLALKVFLEWAQGQERKEAGGEGG